MWSTENTESNYDGQLPRRRAHFLWGPLLIAGIFLLFQYFTSETYVNPETGNKAHVALSPDQERALGLQSFQEVLSQSQVIESGPEVDMVKRVVTKLINQVDEASKQFQWAASLIQSDQANAFCLPGGKIAVYSGILPIASSDAGLATVLGHEIAHATARHGAQRIFKQQMIQTALSGFNGSLGDMSPQGRQMIIGLLGAGAQYGLVLPFSRDDELEADKIGLKYMMRAGYDPEEAIAFWQRMESASESRQPPEWASTHPSHGSRIAQIRGLIDQYRREGL